MPRKNTAGFPGKAERQKLMNGLQASNDPNIRAFAAALTKLDRAMTPYETVQAPFGLAKTLKENDKQTLMAAILEAANVGERYLAECEKTGKNMAQGAPALAEELQSLLSVNYDALSRYEPQMGLSLPELQQAARTVTVDLRGVKLNASAANQNSRLRMTVTDADGTQRQGLFTGEKRVNLLGDYYAALEKAKALCGDNQAAADELQGFLKAYGEKNKDIQKAKNGFDIGLDPTLSEENALAHLAYSLGDTYKKDSAMKILEGAGIVISRIPMAAITAMDEAFAAVKQKQKLSDRLSVRTLKLPEGTRMDDRNASMSAVADLLGIPKLLAKSTPMRCVDQDGNVVEGTFMDYADGVDLNDAAETYCKVTDDSAQIFASGKESHFVQDMLDMQVLDYICGNVDRHPGNMAFKLNDKGQIIGVQGFDNDSSFGLFKNEQEGRLQMNGLNDMRVISKSMYERIQNTTPEMLKLSLRGTGRSTEEIQFACDRLQDMKNLFQEKQFEFWEKGTFKASSMSRGFHVVEDEDLQQLNPKSMSMFLPGSLGAKVVVSVTENHIAAKSMGKKYSRAWYLAHKEELDKRPELTEVSTTERKHTAAGLGDSLQEAAALYKNEATGKFIEKDTGYWCKSSGEFRDMVRAAAKASRLQKDLTQRLSKDPDKEKLLRDDPSISQDKRKADAAINKLAEETEKYLNRKRTQRHAENDEQLVTNAKNEYERERIRYALRLKQAVRSYRDLDNPNAQRESQEKETVKAVVETAKNREAVKAQQAGPAVHA